MRRWLFIIPMVWFASLPAQPTADSPRILKRDGTTFFEHYRYYDAYDKLYSYYQLAPTDSDIWEPLGIAAYHVNELAVAVQVLQRATQTSRPAPDALLFLAKTYQLQHNFTQAVQTYKDFLRHTKTTHPLYALVKDELLRCGYALRRTYRDPDVIVENLGATINDRQDDFAPVPSPIYADRLYFSSVRSTNLGGLRNDAGYQDVEFGFYRADMYSSNIVNGSWNPARPLTALLNSPYHDVVLDFNEDGQVMYYFRGFSLYAGEVLVDTFKTLENRTLVTSNLQSPFQPERGDTAPFFYDDNTLVFASRRAGGYGGLDLYYTYQVDGVWTAAKNLGATVNSAYDETTPFLCKNGQALYFSSNHAQRSRGDYDIFRADFSPTTGEWLPPKNLGEPINSAGDDRYFRLAQDGYYAFFASRRSNSLGGLDIYSVYFKDFQTAQRVGSTNSVFYQVVSNSTNADSSASELPTYTFQPLFYTDENALINATNQNQLRQAATLLRKYPTLQLLVTAHSDDSEPQKFDLFFSIKRAERVAQYLLENGVAKKQIVVRGVGGQYPLAKTGLVGGDDALAQRLNRRITLSFLNSTEQPLQTRTEYPVIAEQLATFEHRVYQKLDVGLWYRIKIATSPQMYKGDIIIRYPHSLVEKDADDPNYQYLVGRYQTYASAHELQKDLRGNGVKDATVVPYLDGQQLSVEEATKYATQIPDLLPFVEAQRKE